MLQRDEQAVHSKLKLTSSAEHARERDPANLFRPRDRAHLDPTVRLGVFDDLLIAMLVEPEAEKEVVGSVKPVHEDGVIGSARNGQFAQPENLVNEWVLCLFLFDEEPQARLGRGQVVRVPKRITLNPDPPALILDSV